MTGKRRKNQPTFESAKRSKTSNSTDEMDCISNPVDDMFKEIFGSDTAEVEAEREITTTKGMLNSIQYIYLK